jgi:tetratricopeptide (TPR) repeat protein
MSAFPRNPITCAFAPCFPRRSRGTACPRRRHGWLPGGLGLLAFLLHPGIGTAAGPPDAGAPAAQNPATNSVRDTSGADANAGLGDARTHAFREFRDAYEAGRYSDALQHAEQVLTLTESMPSAVVDLPIVLDNRGAAYFRLGDYGAAEQDFAHALKLLAENSAVSSPRLIGPLRGLGLTYAAAGRHDVAVLQLERALQISRQSAGLFNLDQLDLLEPLIDSDVALGRARDADRHQAYAYQVAAQHFGPRDTRMIPALGKLARWYSQTRRFTEARELYARVLTIAAPEGDRMLGATVMALRGTAATYRVAYREGAQDPSANAPVVGQPTLLADAKYYLDDDGRAKLEAALKLVEAHRPPLPEARAVLLIELGDWALLAEKPNKAWPRYSEAWGLLATLGAGSGTPAPDDAPRHNPLTYPAQLLYRRPPAADFYRDRPPEAVIEQAAVAEFAVTATGRVQGAIVVEGEATKTHQHSLLHALAHAVYRPRFVDGTPVNTDKVRFRETFRQPKKRR